MRAFPFMAAVTALLVACGADDRDSGCIEGQFSGCICADGRAGQQRCGEETCTCAPQVCELRHASGIDFGALPPGFTAERALVLVNQGDGPCTISGLRLDGCDEGYGVGAALTSGTVEPGGDLPIPVSFHAGGEQPRPCALVFEVSEPQTPQRTVYLTGSVDPACLSVAPAALDFGSTSLGCMTVDAKVAIDNRCGIPVRFDRLALEDGGAFMLRSDPPMPLDLLAGTTLPVRVGYRPSMAGNHAGELRLGFEGFEPVSIPVLGEALEGYWVVDTFKTDPLPQVDYLFVIDNGSSMSDDAESLQYNLWAVIFNVQSQRTDFHIGVTTTGLEPGGDCPGGVGGGEDGRLFPVDGATPRILDRGTPDVGTIWPANFDVGACREGPNHVFEAVVRALTPPVENSSDDPRHPEENDGNAGFLRPDAHLSVLVITDRDDESLESPDRYYIELMGLKGSRNNHLFDFHVIAGDRGSGCANDGRTAAPADRLLSLVEMIGGMSLSICDSDWGWMLVPPRSRIVPVCFYLSRQPSDLNGDGYITEGELEVVVDGLVVPSGPESWYYRPEDGALCFNPYAPPEPESTVEVRYLSGC